MARTDREIVLDDVRWVESAPRDRVGRARATAPIEALQRLAASAPDPWLRARCLGLLDHLANEASTHVFAAALADPVADVRGHAIHGLTCERCRTIDLYVADVVPTVIAAYDAEPVAELRHRLIQVLLRFAGRSALARAKLSAIADEDGDALLRRAAAAALSVGYVRSRKALKRLARARG